MAPLVAVKHHRKKRIYERISRVPMGLLSRVPLEVRIQIYGLLFSGPYYHMPAPEKGQSYSKTTKPADLALLRVCKGISEEVLEVFYGKHIFNFHLESYGRRHLRLSSNHPATSFLKTINLHIEAFIYSEGFVGKCLYLGSATRNSFVNVCSSGITKDTCHVFLAFGKWKGLYRLKQAVLEDIRALTMFKTVIVEVKRVGYPDNYFLSGDGGGSTPISDLGRRSDWCSVPEDEVTPALLYNLEAALGSGHVDKTRSERTDKTSASLCHMTFHPPDHTSKSMLDKSISKPVERIETRCLWSCV